MTLAAADPLLEALRTARPSQIAAISGRCGVGLSQVREWRPRQNLDTVAPWCLATLAEVLLTGQQTKLCGTRGCTANQPCPHHRPSTHRRGA